MLAGTFATRVHARKTPVREGILRETFTGSSSELVLAFGT